MRSAGLPIAAAHVPDRHHQPGPAGVRRRADGCRRPHRLRANHAAAVIARLSAHQVDVLVLDLSLDTPALLRAVRAGEHPRIHPALAVITIARGDELMHPPAAGAGRAARSERTPSASAVASPKKRLDWRMSVGEAPSVRATPKTCCRDATGFNRNATAPVRYCASDVNQAPTPTTGKIRKDENMIGEIRQIAGPDVSGMEPDTPMFHVDIDGADIDSLRTDPVGFFKRLGVGPEQGVAPDGVISVTLSRPNQAWTENGWVDLDVDGAKKKIKWCTYVVGDTAIIHNH
jgi:hypothetical protein